MMSVENKIRSFGSLPDGWHSGSGKRPPSDRILSAVLYAQVMSGFFDKMDAFPGAGGEVLLKGYAPDKERVELTFDADNTYTLAHEQRGVDEFYQDGLSNSEMIVYLRNILSKVQASQWGRLYEWSTHSMITIQQMGPSQILPLRQGRIATVSSQSLASLNHVQLQPVEAPVSTSQNTMPILHQILGSFGALNSPILLGAM